MTCRKFSDPRGFTVTLCSRGSGAKPCATTGCRSAGVALCDFPLTGGKAGATCDRSMCARCRHEQSPGVDYCPPHHVLAKTQP